MYSSEVNDVAKTSFYQRPLPRYILGSRASGARRADVHVQDRVLGYIIGGAQRVRPPLELISVPDHHPITSCLFNHT
jgi:hypothetical protein